jgi:hypothetical protein
MTAHRLSILGGIAIVTIALALWLAAKQVPTAADDEPALLYPALKAQVNSVNAVRIFKAGDARSVELTRKDSGWTVTERDGYAADDAKLRKLLLALANAKREEEKTANPASYPSLGVEDLSDAAATGVRVELAGAPEAVNLIVGKPGVGATSQYVRRAGEPQSWLIDTNLDAPSSPDAWLRKEIVDVTADRIQSASVSIKGAKSYTASKATRADADFAVDGLPKGKELSAPSAANTFATALVGLVLSDVKPLKELESTAPSAHTTLRTFDGLVVDIDGWTKDDKHFIAVKTSFDPALAERFKVATAPADAKPAEGATPPAAASPPKPDVAAEAKTLSAKLAGWAQEIPQYKYDAIFKPLDELLKK